MRKLFSLGFVALLALGVTAQSTFASDETYVQVTGTTLSITEPAAGNFTPVVLNGQNQTTNASLEDFTVVDARGTGVGWTVTAQADKFVAGMTESQSHELSWGSLTMSTPEVTGQSGSSAEPYVANGPYTIDIPMPVVIANAEFGQGMGTYDFSSTNLTLAIPASTYADIYESNVTITFQVAP